MKEILNENILNLSLLSRDDDFLSAVDLAVAEITNTLQAGLPLMVFGNGGSASDAMHISGELVGKFNLSRRALNVICLNTNTTVITAWANDFEYDSVFARQIDAHGRNGGIAWGITTSGNSFSVLNALKRAKELGIKTIALTGQGGGNAAHYADILLDVPSNKTPRIQEMHLPIYHYMCSEIEKKCLSANYI